MSSQLFSFVNSVQTKTKENVGERYVDNWRCFSIKGTKPT